MIVNGDGIIATIYERQNGTTVVVFNTNNINFERGLEMYDSMGNSIKDEELENIIMDFIIPKYGYTKIK